MLKSEDEEEVRCEIGSEVWISPPFILNFHEELKNHGKPKSDDETCMPGSDRKLTKYG